MRSKLSYVICLIPYRPYEHHKRINPDDVKDENTKNAQNDLGKQKKEVHRYSRYSKDISRMSWP